MKKNKDTKYMVKELLQQAKTTNAIACELSISPSAVKQHIKTLMKWYNVDSRYRLIYEINKELKEEK